MKSHHPQRIAKSSVAAVDACDCGTVHLHVGTVTVHLTPQALQTLAQTLEKAAARMRDESLSTWSLRKDVAVGVC